MTSHRRTYVFAMPKSDRRIWQPTVGWHADSQIYIFVNPNNLFFVRDNRYRDFFSHDFATDHGVNNFIDMPIQLADAWEIAYLMDSKKRF